MTECHSRETLAALASLLPLQMMSLSIWFRISGGSVAQDPAAEHMITPAFHHAVRNM